MIPGIVASQTSLAPTPPTGVAWNPADKSANVNLSNGNLTATRVTGATNEAVRATLSRSTGKYYFECELSQAGSPSNFPMVGLGNAAMSLNGYVGQGAGSWGYEATGFTYHNGSGAAYGASLTTGDVWGVAVDLDAGLMWFAKNGTWQASGDPAGGSNPAFTGVTGILFPAGSMYDSATQAVLTARFAPSDFTQTIPSGFSPWE